MLWKSKKQRHQEERDQEELKREKKQKKNLKTKPGVPDAGAGAGAGTAPFTSSRFSISRLLPISWISSKFMPKPKRSSARTGNSNPITEAQTRSGAFSPPPPPPPRRLSPGFPSCHLSFRHAAADLELDSARFPPSVVSRGETDVPHRRSLGDDGARRPPKFDQSWRSDRRRHHYSMGDLQLPELQQLIQFSVPMVASGSDDEREASSDYEVRSPPLRPLQDRRRSKAVRPADADRTDACPRRSLSGKTRRHRARPKVKISSPRPSAAAAAVRRKRVSTPAEEEKVRELERFAVVKRSRDPQRDFRESMVEMICERGIGRPEEFERLLACYLSLNADEYHNVIVKVFRQVWFELKPDLFNKDCYCY